ncbi:hypothetical protein CCL22_02310 [Pseudomonas syringae]|nr:hypothetical protein CCL22_02310 [Pseudomonas syringae]
MSIGGVLQDSPVRGHEAVVDRTLSGPLFQAGPQSRPDGIDAFEVITFPNQKAGMDHSSAVERTVCVRLKWLFRVELHHPAGRRNLIKAGIVQKQLTSFLSVIAVIQVDSQGILRALDPSGDVFRPSIFDAIGPQAAAQALSARLNTTMTQSVGGFFCQIVGWRLTADADADVDQIARHASRLALKAACPYVIGGAWLRGLVILMSGREGRRGISTT